MATLDETKAAGDINEHYVLGDEIGRGSFSTVRRGRHKATNKEFAVKCIQKKFIKMHLLEREIKIMKKLQHPHILPLIEVYESKESIYLVLELVTGGELFDKIVERGNYSENDAGQIIGQILSAVEYLHTQGVVHRDLKPENLLCSEVGASATNPSGVHIYVADFGLSRVFQDREQLNTYCGSPEYVAPEVLACVPYEKAVDLWSVGVITYILLTRFLPFYDKNHSVLFEKIQNVDYNWDDCPEVSAAAKHFIQHLLVKDPKKRYPAEAALQHPWITREGVAKLQQRPSYQNLLKEINDKKQPKKN